MWSDRRHVGKLAKGSSDLRAGLTLAAALAGVPAMVYMLKGTEGEAENADPRLLEKTDDKEDRRRPA